MTQVVALVLQETAGSPRPISSCRASPVDRSEVWSAGATKHFLPLELSEVVFTYIYIVYYVLFFFF